jgi:hypothetical protein
MNSSSYVSKSSKYWRYLGGFKWLAGLASSIGVNVPIFFDEIENFIRIPKDIKQGKSEVSG